MTDTASTDMTDTTFTDLGPFFRRYDRRQRLLFGGALCASLVLSAIIATHVIDTGWTAPRSVVRVVWGLGVVLCPLFVIGWWTFAELMAWGRRKAASADGSHRAGPDDARNGMRIANAGFAYNIAVLGTWIAGQVFIALLVFRAPPVGLLPSRILMWVVGAVTIYLGNLWPRMPTARTPDRSGAIRMKANRVSGWIMVISGLVIVLLGLFLPLLHPGLRP